MKNEIHERKKALGGKKNRIYTFSLFVQVNRKIKI